MSNPTCWVLCRRVNLTFDPMVFEDPVLGVKVHRGVYAAAQALYDRFLPLVEEHLASSPYAKIMFTVRCPARTAEAVQVPSSVCCALLSATMVHHQVPVGTEVHGACGRGTRWGAAWEPC